MKLTKADIGKVRQIEGFPTAKDEDIIALSRPPYYTACPNPFIEDFIRENGTPYNEVTDDYHREPFAADVSEGKNDPIYMAHSYHTKVPYKAIMRYILHYTKPGDIIFDGFCGTGMTGVAAQMCGCVDSNLKSQLEQEMRGSQVQWGARKAVLNDLSPAATFIAHNYNTPVEVTEFERIAQSMLDDCERECGWVYKTQHVINRQPQNNIEGKPLLGQISYTIWSDVFVCPSCSKEIVYWKQALKPDRSAFYDAMTCSHCGVQVKKTDCERAYIVLRDLHTNTTKEHAKQVPVLISYYINGRRYEKEPDSYDYDLIERIESCNCEYWYPNNELPIGEKTQDPINLGIDRVDLFYTKRNLIVLSKLWDSARNSDFTNQIRWILTSIIIKTASKLHNVGFKDGKINLAGAMPNALYVPGILAERNIIELARGKLSDIIPAFQWKKDWNVLVSCGSTGDLRNIPSDCIDYIFTDPPFGSNLNYSELSFIWDSWLKVLTNTKQEAIISRCQKKGLLEYQGLMELCFRECARILKPEHWITVEFHNSKNAVWNSIQEALLRAGFIVADVRTINKGQGSYNQMTSAGAVKQDLVISAYKPKDSFVREFKEQAGHPDMAWEFVRQHLENVPIAPDANGKIEIVAERQDYLLFDRMVAYHIMNGIPVPMDAHTFYAGLRQRFLMRDGMFFLPDQVNEYDEKRTMMELDETQLAFVISDEKSVIQWLNYQLSTMPMTYSELYNPYMQELHQSKYEALPELMEMLRDSFLQDEKGRWYVPDLSDAADLAKLRIKKLVKEFFDTYATGIGKLKVFRLEAIRAGFDECWKDRNYALIAKVGARLPDTVLQEDPSLLMYYDNACGRL